jgi:magnesium transporter
MAEQRIEPGGEDDREDAYALDRQVVSGVLAGVEEGNAEAVAALLEPLHAADIADLVEQMGAAFRRPFLDLVWDGLDPEILVELEEGVRDEVLAALPPERIAEAARDLDTDDVVYLCEALPSETQEAVLAALDPADRAAISRALAYPEYSAGRLMQSDFVRAPPYWTVGQMIDYLRAAADLPEPFYDVIVVDPAMRPVGEIRLSQIIGNRRPVVLESLMVRDFRTLHVEDSQEDVAYAFNQYHLVSCPVVDDDGRVVGVITIDDAMAVLEDEAEEDIRRLGGVGDEEITDRVVSITRRRFPWLAINLATAVLASVVIGVFDAVIAEVVALAVLMPIVASMGGNAGTQTLTVAVRALATRDLTTANMLRVVAREGLVGFLNGLAFAVLVGAIAWAWYGDPMLGGVIAVAMAGTMVVAALAGILIPIGLDRIGVDPALASGAFVTTVTDVVGFFVFLGLAAIILL